MNRDELEGRLAAAYQARAASLTEDDLRPVGLSDVPVHGEQRSDNGLPASRRSRWMLPLLAAAAVAALAGGTVTVAHLALHHPQPPATHVPPAPTPGLSTNPPAPAPSATKSAAPKTQRQSAKVAPMLGLGQESPRSAIPWSRVDAGWSVVLWTRQAPTGGAKDVVGTAFLVDPIGGRYLIATLAQGDALADVSGDHRRALIDTIGPTSTKITQLDLVTGALSPVTTVPGTVVVVTYTKPFGKAILVWNNSLEVSKKATVERIGLDGSRQHAYATGLTGQAGLPLSTPDGLTVVFDGVPALTAMSNDGSNPHPLATPAGASSCSPVRWWTPGVLLATCFMKDRGTQLWLAPLDGGAATALTRSVVGLTDPVEAWQLGSRVYVGSRVSCGGGEDVNRLNPDGSLGPVQISAPTGIVPQPMHVSGVTATDIYATVNLDCQTRPGRTLVRYTPSTSAVTVLFGGSVGGGTVLRAITLGADH